MRVLFVIQGEGRGHFTQALVMEEMLRRHGDQLVAVLVGKSPARILPGYFANKMPAPVYSFESPNFLPAPQNKRPELIKSIVYNIRHGRSFYKSMVFIRQKIEELQPDLVINFYELMTGLTYLLMPPGVPLVCIGHQYLFLHPDFSFPRHLSGIQLFSLRFFTRITSLKARRKLALSFYPCKDGQGVIVVPPLIRKEVKECVPVEKDYILGYLLNSGYQEEVETWHQEHLEEKLHFFWDKKEVPGYYAVDSNFVLHQIDDTLFVEYMAGCKAYATTAGFESVCEALYLHKPVLMVPAHIEQACNAFDACRVRAGRVSASFDLDQLLKEIDSYCPDENFCNWADLAEQKIYAELQSVCQDQREKECIYDKWIRILRSATSRLHWAQMLIRS